MGYKKDNWSDAVRSSCVEAGSNTSIVALRVVGDDKKEPSTWGYNRTILFLRDINTGTWPSMLGDF
jgi:hypothetical protein